MRVVYLWGKLEQNWIVVPYCEPFSYRVVHIHKYSNIQSYSLLSFHDPSTQTPSWAYFDTPAILLSRSDSVGVLWLAATLARINKRKWSLKIEKVKKNLNTIAEDFSSEKIVYIQGSPALWQPFFPCKPHMQTFLTFQSKWAPEDELCLNNNLAFRGRYSTKSWIIWIINSNV